jgi:glutathione S-transferase
MPKLLLLQMVLTLYHYPPSYPSRTAVMVARAVGVDITVKTVDLLEGDHLSPVFIKVR